MTFAKIWIESRPTKRGTFSSSASVDTQVHFMQTPASVAIYFRYGQSQQIIIHAIYISVFTVAVVVD